MSGGGGEKLQIPPLRDAQGRDDKVKFVCVKTWERCADPFGSALARVAQDDNDFSRTRKVKVWELGCACGAASGRPQDPSATLRTGSSLAALTQDDKRGWMRLRLSSAQALRVRLRMASWVKGELCSLPPFRRVRGRMGHPRSWLRGAIVSVVDCTWWWIG